MAGIFRLIAFAALTAFLPAAAQAETAITGNLVIEAPWARASIGVRRPGAAFVTIRNRGSLPDTLTAIETIQAERAEVHRTRVSNGIATMSPAGRVEIPAGDQVIFAPGGLHIMLMGLSSPLTRGSTFPMTLVFERAGQIEITIPVLGPGARGPEE
jgi:periplasmic copper chaperone A